VGQDSQDDCSSSMPGGPFPVLFLACWSQGIPGVPGLDRPHIGPPRHPGDRFAGYYVSTANASPAPGGVCPIRREKTECEPSTRLRKAETEKLLLPMTQKEASQPGASATGVHCPWFGDQIGSHIPSKGSGRILPVSTSSWWPRCSLASFGLWQNHCSLFCASTWLSPYVQLSPSLFLFFFFFQHWGLNSGPHAC
jgi:hypothetical protein